jgi:hypothetical protein
MMVVMVVVVLPMTCLTPRDAGDTRAEWWEVVRVGGAHPHL